ncbi:glycosyltransferase family 2 protein [Naasia lichenicola]|uniref:Glycosyltransferase family 2 protein n=1 Tax=Naasia lichenicola TaxID=2565933 RepID=A0A4S4FLR0_9MICO|nr:glycosyltransferase family 2 protein [Naasia lichenicola]THG30842.1 glycosyltransferase family 2 protein [Naasia lichenicola]
MTEPARGRTDGPGMPVAVVMPAYNEAESLPVFLAEIAESLRPVVSSLHFVVVDDLSTDSTAAVLEELRIVGAEVVSVRSPSNRGHGPTALNAYREGLLLDVDVIIHVDGDGQFIGSDFRRALAALHGADVVHGVRTSRTDPWFRRVITAVTSFVAALLAGHRIPDVNTPLRVYRRPAIERLISLIPESSLVPHIHFSLLERAQDLRVHYVRVQSIPRRGASVLGTMWNGSGERRPALPSGRLLRFSRDAALEVLRLRVLRLRPALSGSGEHGTRRRTT